MFYHLGQEKKEHKMIRLWKAFKRKACAFNYTEWGLLFKDVSKDN